MDFLRNYCLTEGYATAVDGVVVDEAVENLKDAVVAAAADDDDAVVQNCNGHSNLRSSLNSFDLVD